MQKSRSLTKRAITLFVASILVACNHNKADNSGQLTVEPASAIESRLPEPDILQRLSYHKDLIDTMFYNGKYIGDSYGLLKEGHVIRMTDKLVEESGMFSKTYLIIKDTAGNIVRINESPYSESGDWSLSVSHYFDNNDKTFVVEKQFGMINSPCADGSAFEQKTAYYDSQMKLIGKNRSLTQGNKAIADSCIYPFYNDYLVSPTSAACLRQFGLDTVGRAAVNR